MDDTPPYRTDGGDRDERSSDEEYVHEPAVDHETWESVTGGDIEDAPADPDSERRTGARTGPDASQDAPRDVRRDPREGGERTAPGRGEAARRPTDRQADAAGGRQAETRGDRRADTPQGGRTDWREEPRPDRRDAGRTNRGREQSDQPAQRPDQRRGTAEWTGAAPEGSDAPVDADEPRSSDWDAARGREQAAEESTTRVPAVGPTSVADAVATAVVAHVAVGVGVAAMVVILGIVSRPMFGRRDAIDPVYLVEGEVLIHALPALALALAAGTGLYVAGRRRATGDLADAGLGDTVRAVVPAAALAAGGGSLALAVLVVGAAALLLDPFLSFQPLNFLLATGVLAVAAAAVAALAGVGTALGVDQIPLRSSNSA